MSDEQILTLHGGTYYRPPRPLKVPFLHMYITPPAGKTSPLKYWASRQYVERRDLRWSDQEIDSKIR